MALRRPAERLSAASETKSRNRYFLGQGLRSHRPIDRLPVRYFAVQPEFVTLALKHARGRAKSPIHVIPCAPITQRPHPAAIE